jgi:hypothetical protein
MKTNKEVKDFKPSAFSFFNQEKLKESWKVISEKEDLNWNMDFIENNTDNLDWKALSFNDSLTLSVAFIKQFEKHWDWHALSYIIADKIYFDSSDFNVLLKRYKEMLDWKVICQGTNLNHHHLTDYSESIEWDSLSSNSWGINIKLWRHIIAIELWNWRRNNVRSSIGLFSVAMLALKEIKIDHRKNLNAHNR